MALVVDGIRSPEDLEAFLRIGKAIPIFSHHASFLGRCLLALSFLWPAGLLQKVFEEFAILVEVFDGVGVVGSWAIHEFVEVVRQGLLGLLARAVSCGDQRGVVRSAPILFVLLAPLCGGALVLVRALCLAFVPASVEDRSDRLLVEGVVSGDLE